MTVLAARSENSARLAIEHARDAKRNLKQDLSSGIARLRQEMDEFERLFSTLPLDKTVKSLHARGKLSLNEAEIAFEKGDYNRGRDKSQDAAQAIRAAYGDAGSCSILISGNCRLAETSLPLRWSCPGGSGVM